MISIYLLFLLFTQISSFVSLINSTLPIVRIFYDETKPSKSLKYWEKYSYSLLNGNYDILFGGGRNRETVLQSYQSENEIVLISIDEPTQLTYFLGTKKFIIHLIEPLHPMPLSVSLVPKYSSLISLLEQLLNVHE